MTYSTLLGRGRERKLINEVPSRFLAIVLIDSVSLLPIEPGPGFQVLVVKSILLDPTREADPTGILITITEFREACW